MVKVNEQAVLHMPFVNFFFPSVAFPLSHAATYRGPTKY